MDFVASLCGFAKLGEQVGVLTPDSDCLLSCEKFAVESVTANLISPLRFLAAQPLPKPALGRLAGLPVPVALLPAPCGKFLPFDVILRWLVLMLLILMPLKNKI
jgi:hypothetical protein